MGSCSRRSRGSLGSFRSRSSWTKKKIGQKIRQKKWTKFRQEIAQYIAQNKKKRPFDQAKHHTLNRTKKSDKQK